MVIEALMVLAAAVGAWLFAALLFRRVVPTNEVHIIQSAGSTTSYGKDSKNGNTYYKWPSWIPRFGVVTSVLPTSVFTRSITNYEAYDQGRLPFMLDLTAFFRIADSNTAAQRVSSTSDLMSQLDNIVKGAARTILASHDIEHILQGRSTFGEAFTTEVAEQLKEWGVQPVKNIELMDIRDSGDSHVIENIMAKKESLIEKDSRVAVAANRQQAEIAEIEAKREVDLQAQAAQQAVGLRTVENEKAVNVSRQTALQEIKEQERTTKEKEMAVVSVAKVRDAEIVKSVEMVRAEQNKQTAIIHAEGMRQQTVITAEGNLEAKKREALGIEAEGLAKAEAEKAMQLAPVQAQITLAKEIGENHTYQEYLIQVEQIAAAREVGKAQAAALEKADVKIISNAGSPTDGLTGVMDLVSAKGGTKVGAMFEALAQTDTGKSFLERLNGTDKGAH